MRIITDERLAYGAILLVSIPVAAALTYSIGVLGPAFVPAPYGLLAPVVPVAAYVIVVFAFHLSLPEWLAIGGGS